MPAKARKSKPVIDFLSVGEGRLKGPAFKFAQALSRREKQGKAMAIDVKAPTYELPKNMAFIPRDALTFIEGMRSSSVKIVRDDLFFQYAMYGKGKATPRQQQQALKAFENSLHAPTASYGPAPPNFRKNELKYIRHVKRVLIPGGRFVLTADAKTAQCITRLLVQEGFQIRTHKELNEEQIMRAGSPHTIMAFKAGERMYRIIAVKP